MVILNNLIRKYYFKGSFLLILILLFNLSSTQVFAIEDINSSFVAFNESNTKKKNKNNKKKKSNKSNKSNSSSAVSSNLIFAPSSIKAGSSGSCLIHLNNPTDDTLHFVVFPEMPFGWKLINKDDVTIVYPNSKKTVALMLVPSNLTSIGLHRISFDFVDSKHDIIITEEVIIDIKENRQIILSEILGNRNLRKGGAGLPLKYKVYNAGNVPEMYHVVGDKKKILYQINPGDTIFHDVLIKIPTRTNLKNYFDIFEISILKAEDAEIVEEKTQRLTTSITILTSGIHKPVSRFSIPLTTSTGITVLNNTSNTNYSFTEGINVAVPNKKQTELTKLNLQLFGNNGGGIVKTRLDGKIEFNKEIGKSTLTAQAGASSTRGYFFFRIPNNLFNTGVQIEGKKYRTNTSIAVKIPQFTSQDSTQRLRQIFLSRKLSERVKVSTHHFSVDYSNSNNFTNVSTINYDNKIIKIDNSIITHKEVSEVFRPSQLALSNNISFRNKNNALRISTFLSGENFTRGNENMRFLQYDLNKTINNLSVKIAQELFNQAPLFNPVSEIERDQFILSTNYNLDKFQANLSVNRFTLANTIALKENKTMNESVNMDLSFSLNKGAQINLNMMASNQETSIDNTIQGDIESRTVGVLFNSPMFDKNSFSVGATSLFTNEQEVINTQGSYNRRINRKSTLSFQTSYRMNINNHALDIFQSKAEFGYRFNRTNIKVGANVSRLGNGLVILNGLANVTKTFSIARRDTVSFKQLNGIVIDDSGNPIANVVMTIGNHLIITDEFGEFFVHDIIKNKVRIEIEKSSLPFGVKSYEGNSIDILLLKEKNDIQIKTFRSAALKGASKIERSGLFRGALPIYQNYYAVLTSIDDPKNKHYTQLDNDGTFKLEGIDPGTWSLKITCAAKSNAGWQLEQDSFELEIKPGDIIQQELIFSDKAPNLKIQKGLYVPKK